MPAWHGNKESERTNVNDAITAQAGNGTSVSPLSPVSPGPLSGQAPGATEGLLDRVFFFFFLQILVVKRQRVGR